MYHFAVIALAALAVVKVVDFLTDNISGLDRARTLLTFVGSILTMVALDYSLFAGWEIPIRDADVGVWVTGFMVAGLTVPWRAVFGFLTHDQATKDETLGEHVPMIGKAA